MGARLLDTVPATAIPLFPVAESALAEWLPQQDEHLQRWVATTGFTAKPGSVCLLPGERQTLQAVIVGISASDDPWTLGGLPPLLPGGEYRLVAADWTVEQRERAALSWLLGSYQFDRYRAAKPVTARLAVPEGCNARRIGDYYAAIALIRDLINTPAQDMMPQHLATVAEQLAGEFGADFSQIVGEQLLSENYPVIHAVGRASVHPPRLLDLRWGDERHPQLTLVGKGVCFDSGGLDLKSAANMRLMKKDMGGAAHALGLARLIMSAGLPVRLRVLVAAVENAVSGDAFRPGDVLRSRQGLTIEIDNTDAEGRLILCDALAAAVVDQPAVLLDFATLTGAARVALGTEVPALFCNNEALATDLLQAATAARDPIWRLPLHRPYRELLDSKIADIANSSAAPYGGAITAALFLQEFVPATIPWAHFDVMAWNTRAKPGRPEGGEAMGLCAVFRCLSERFG